MKNESWQFLPERMQNPLLKFLHIKAVKICCKSIDVSCVKKAIVSLNSIVVSNLLFSMLGVDRKREP